MKVALVTGASGAIGRAIALALSGQGHHVIAHGHRNMNKCDQVVEAIRDAGGSAESVCFDVSDYQQSKTSLERLLEKAPIQILINNAGTHDDAVMPGMSAQQWHGVIDASLNSFFHVSQPLLMPMIRSRWGRIVSISSVAGQIGNRGQSNYAAAKAGIHGATRSLALELASRAITVNAVAPGIIDTAMSQSAFDDEQIKRLVPMKRAGRPDEVSAAVEFLCSQQASYISGQIIGVNGALA